MNVAEDTYYPVLKFTIKSLQLRQYVFREKIYTHTSKTELQIQKTDPHIYAVNLIFKKVQRQFKG